ncbi:hypothetical protein XJ76305_2676 [Enterococcus faecalis]|nr:hypothetical protein XJ76305_2676 [Enterococcus faecalis]
MKEFLKNAMETSVNFFKQQLYENFFKYVTLTTLLNKYMG